MPELPEVETVRRQLQSTLVGARFMAVERIEASMLRDCVVDEFVSKLRGQTVETVERLGKFLIARLSAGLYLTVHLGMTGQLLVDPSEQSQHARFVFRISREDSGDRQLVFRDTRKFGKVHLTEGGPAPRVARLGPDAWRGEWDSDYLREKLGSRRTPIKAFLLDQRQLAGIGNIYADEILWWTGISPLRPSGSLGSGEVEGLAAEIRHRLGEGVRFLGCTFSDFVDTLGEQGGFQDWLRAYGKAGQQCDRCGATLERIVVVGRGTTYCAGCQK